MAGFSSGIAKVLTAGWSLSSVIVAQSGTPLWVVNTNSPTAPVNPGDYHLVGTNYDIPNKPSFACSASSSRSAFRSGLFTTCDFSACSRWMRVWPRTRPKLGEGGNLQLRFDFVNLFNRANLGPVDGNMADLTFGRMTSALPARQIQLIVRIFL